MTIMFAMQQEQQRIVVEFQRYGTLVTGLARLRSAEARGLDVQAASLSDARGLRSARSSPLRELGLVTVMRMVTV